MDNSESPISMFAGHDRDIANLWRRMLDPQNAATLTELQHQVASLTRSEYAILDGLTKGYGGKALAMYTGYSQATIALQTPTILEKMGAHYRAGAAAKLLLWRAITAADFASKMLQQG